VKPQALIAGRYRLLRPIGRGASGTVWAAQHELLGREFALKIAGVGQRMGLDARARFLREVQIVGRLRHPNIVDIADAGEVGPGEGLYLAMELLEGKSLAQYLATNGPMPPAEALAVTAEVCRALSAAHGAGVVHRDIKPENIFLANDPRSTR
jgi:serine/threonine-protein kinase